MSLHAFLFFAGYSITDGLNAAYRFILSFKVFGHLVLEKIFEGFHHMGIAAILVM